MMAQAKVLLRRRVATDARAACAAEPHAGRERRLTRGTRRRQRLPALGAELRPDQIVMATGGATHRRASALPRREQIPIQAQERP